MDARILEFGEQLLELGDLDPVYNYLASIEIDEETLKRWLLTYSMFYHCGVADRFAALEGHEYWDSIKKNIVHLPRGEERRHFRGSQANTSIEFMSEYQPETIVTSWYREPNFKAVSASVQRIPIYGPWIAFKMADMGERVLRKPVDFSNCTLGIYKEPRLGAAIVFHEDIKADAITDEEIEEVIDYITSSLNAKGYKAPPWEDRPLNVQEAETILCKYKSHLHGHYPVGKDIAAVEKAKAWKYTS